MRHEIFGLAGLAQAFFDGPLDRTSPARNWFSASSPTAHPAIAQVVDVVDLALPLRRSTRILMTARMSSGSSGSGTDQPVAPDTAV